MLACILLLVCTHVLGAHTDDGGVDSTVHDTTTYVCSSESAGEYVQDAFTFLEEDAKIHMVMTSLPTVFTLPGPDSTPITCITAITTGKNEETREFIQTVHYKYGTSDTSQKWESFSQSFRLEGELENYYRMNITEVNGAPFAVYEFKYTTRNCAVMTVKGFEYRMAENAEPSERSGSNAEVSDAAQGSPSEVHTDEDANDGKAHCIMWAKGNNVNALQKFCERFYNQCCKKKNGGYEYHPQKCQIPEEKEL